MGRRQGKVGGRWTRQGVWKVEKGRWVKGGQGKVSGRRSKGRERMVVGNVGGLFFSLSAEGLKDCELPIPLYIKLYYKFCETCVSESIQDSEPVFGS